MCRDKCLQIVSPLGKDTALHLNKLESPKGWFEICLVVLGKKLVFSPWFGFKLPYRGSGDEENLYKCEKCKHVKIYDDKANGNDD